MKLKVERRGRKRKSGNRHPGGQLVDEKPPDRKVVALRMPHRQDVPRHLAHDAKAESVLGRYNLNGRITNIEYDAAIWYRGVVQRYRATIHCPSPDPKSIAGETVRGAPTEFTEEEARTRKEACDGAYQAAMEAGQKGAKYLARVVVFDEQCPSEYFRQFRLAMWHVAVHNGMCTRTKFLDMTAKL